LTDLMARLGHRLIGVKRSREELRAFPEGALVDREANAAMGYAVMMGPVAGIAAVVGGLLSLGGRRPFGTTLGEVIFGVAAFCLVALTLHTVLYLYAGRVEDRQGRLGWLHRSPAVDYVLLVVVVLASVVLRPLH